MLNNTIISIDFETPPEVARKIAANVKARRLERNFTQAGLASRAGVKLPTYRKFETTGRISLLGLLRIGFALGCLEDFHSLFGCRQYESIDQIIEQQTFKRKRGRNA